MTHLLLLSVITAYHHVLRMPISSKYLKTVYKSSSLASTRQQLVDVSLPGNLSIPSTQALDSSYDDEANEKLINLVVSAIADNREEDLIKAGMKISTKQSKDVINRKLSDKQLNEQILGDIDDDQMDIMNSLMAEMQKVSSITPATDIGIDNELLDRIRQEAVITMQNMQENQVSILSSMDKVESEDAYFERLSNVDDINDKKIQELRAASQKSSETDRKLFLLDTRS
jgi:hypothetical protein